MKKRLGGLEPVLNAGTRGITFNAWEALPLIYSADSQGIVSQDGQNISLTEARTRESLSKTRLNQIEIESKERTRIPLHVVEEVMEAALVETKAIIQRSPLPDEAKGQIFEELASIPERLKW